MHLILFGFKGSGKTYFGQRAATVLNRIFIDTDDLMIQEYTKQTGHSFSIRQLYQTLGEIDFRKLEELSIKNLTLNSQAVIALGGGTFLNSHLITSFQAIGKLIYLKASFPLIQQRIFQKELPSFIDIQNPLDSLFKIYKKRILLYESILAKQIPVDDLSEAEILAEIVNHGI